MAKEKKTKAAIYHPPKKGMPYMGVAVSSEGVTVTAVESEKPESSLPTASGYRWPIGADIPHCGAS